MGNAGSSNLPARERHKSGSSDIGVPSSPCKPGVGGEGQAFVFDKKPDTRLVLHQGSQEDEGPYYTPSTAMQQQQDTDLSGGGGGAISRPRSNTASESASNRNSFLESDSDTGEEKKPALPTVFKWDGGGKAVYISGTFSNWKTLPMVRSHGDFVTIIDLPEGDHEYKFFVDGEWKHDPKLKNIENEAGTKNNLVSVRQSDFEVFQALAKDSEDAANQAQKEYSQDIPQAKPWEKVSGPPVLPPHLLQVILNKDTPLSCEPTLLPEPNHVMLNHLYALSIKDGVMVLSATHRYRKKYVTTLLYKPI